MTKCLSYFTIYLMHVQKKKRNKVKKQTLNAISNNNNEL